MDAVVYRLLEMVEELTRGLRPGTPEAQEVRAYLLGKLESARLNLGRADAIRIESIIEARCK